MEGKVVEEMRRYTTDWVSYYHANRRDRGTIEALYALDDADDLTEIAKNHNNDRNGLRTTIAGSGGNELPLSARSQRDC